VKLKPCPFCGGKRVSLDDVGSGFAVDCDRARYRAMGPLVEYGSVQHRDENREALEAKAARLWNARAGR
jgi:hypothetical protein